MQNLYKAEYYACFKDDNRQCKIYSVVSAENLVEAENFAKEYLSLIKKHPSVIGVPVFVEAKELGSHFGIEDFIDSSFIEICGFKTPDF